MVGRIERQMIPEEEGMGDKLEDQDGEVVGADGPDDHQRPAKAVLTT